MPPQYSPASWKWWLEQPLMAFRLEVIAHAGDADHRIPSVYWVPKTWLIFGIRFVVYRTTLLPLTNKSQKHRNTIKSVKMWTRRVQWLQCGPGSRCGTSILRPTVTMRSKVKVMRSCRQSDASLPITWQEKVAERPKLAGRFSAPAPRSKGQRSSGRLMPLPKVIHIIRSGKVYELETWYGWST